MFGWRRSLGFFAGHEQLAQAAKALDAMAPELLGRHREVPWQSVKGMREKLAHDYDTISVSILWNTVKQELPVLRRATEELSAGLSKE